MPKKSKKSKSKRMTLKQKYKIIKKVKEHHKKKKKELKKKGLTEPKRKDPGLPSQWPFKEELIKEFAWKRAQILADEKRKKEERKARRQVGGQGCGECACMCAVAQASGALPCLATLEDMQLSVALAALHMGHSPQHHGCSRGQRATAAGEPSPKERLVTSSWPCIGCFRPCRLLQLSSPCATTACSHKAPEQCSSQQQEPGPSRTDPLRTHAHPCQTHHRCGTNTLAGRGCCHGG